MMTNLPEEMRERLSDIIYEAQSWVDDDELKRKARVVAIDAIMALLEDVDRRAREEGMEIGQYQAADAIYGKATSTYMVASDSELLKGGIGDVVSKCESYLNKNKDIYMKYLISLQPPSKESNMKTYKPSTELYYVIESDGDAWFAHYNTFTNVQESDEVAFGKTPEEALHNLIKRSASKESGS